MTAKFRALMILVVVCALAYFSYSAFWLAKTVPWISDISLNAPAIEPPTGFLIKNSFSVSSAYAMEYTGFIGLILRTAGAAYALAAAIMILKDGEGSFTKHKGKLTAALLLSGLYYFSLIPSVFYLLNFSALPVISNRLLATTLLAQIALICTFLLFLWWKMRKNSPDVSSVPWLKLAALAALAYVGAIWIVYMSKWAEMMAVDPYLFSAWSARIIGFLNTVTVQSLAVVFAITGAVCIYRKSSSFKTLLLWGLAAVFLGLHTTIYSVYCYAVGIPRFIGFGELWQIPLMALGIYFMWASIKSK